MIDSSIRTLKNGSFFSIQSVLEKVIPETLKDEKIRVEFSANGANVGKYRTFTNFTVTFIDEPSAEKRRPHLRAVLEESEKYENVQELLSLYNTEIDLLNSGTILVGSKNVQILLCADYKFILIALGMKAATSSHACIYCKCPNNMYYKGAGDRRQHIRKRDPGCKQENLLPCIKPWNIVVDVMHMYFRISDRLFHLLIEHEVPDDPASRAALRTALEPLGVNGRLVTTTSGTLEFSSLQSRDRDKIISAIERGTLLDSLMGKTKRAQCVRALFSKFQKTYETVRHSGDAATVRTECESFMAMFVALYPKHMVTPYIHLLAYHVPELVELHGVLGSFSQQAVEKENHKVTSAYFSCTNFHTPSRQLLRKTGRRLLRL